MTARHTGPKPPASPEDPAGLRHQLDAPSVPFEQWLGELETGECTRCGGPAERGRTRWWHTGTDCALLPRPAGTPRPARFRAT